MPRTIEQLSPWVDTHEALVKHLGSATQIMALADYSEDPGSDFQRARAEMARIQWEINRLTLERLRQIDDAIAAGDLVKQLTEMADRARREADRINQAIETLGEITAAVNTVVGIVDQITGLPFLSIAS